MKHLLITARHEIIDLRRRNELLEAQIAIVHVFAAALGLKHESQGMSVDIAWELQNKINEMDKS